MGAGYSHSLSGYKPVPSRTEGTQPLTSMALEMNQRTNTQSEHLVRSLTLGH